MQERK